MGAGQFGRPGRRATFGCGVPQALPSLSSLNERKWKPAESSTGTRDNFNEEKGGKKPFRTSCRFYGFTWAVLKYLCRMAMKSVTVSIPESKKRVTVNCTSRNLAKHSIQAIKRNNEKVIGRLIHSNQAWQSINQLHAAMYNGLSSIYGY